MAPAKTAPNPNGKFLKRSDEGPIRLFGVHTVEAALRNFTRELGRLLLTENAERRMSAAIAARAVTPKRVLPRDLDRNLGADTVHQGALLETMPLPEPELTDLAAAAGRGGPLLALDQVTDPHNVGAILRSAAVFGASGVVMTRRRSPPLSGTLAKSASGALEIVPVALVPNLARALAEFRELGLTRIGLDADGETLIDAQDFSPPLVFVLGAEDRGLRRLTREMCDGVCRIRTAGSLASLNVSNAAAVALHLAAMRQREMSQKS